MNSDKIDIIVSAVTEAWKNGRYYVVYGFLKTIAFSSGDTEALARIEKIREDMPIDINKFEYWYYRSKGVNPRRKITFTYNKVPKVMTMEEIQPLFETYVINPLSIEFFRIVGSLSQSKGLLLQKAVSQKTSTMKKIMENKGPEVILDA